MQFDEMGLRDGKVRTMKAAEQIMKGKQFIKEEMDKQFPSSDGSPCGAARRNRI